MKIDRLQKAHQIIYSDELLIFVYASIFSYTIFLMPTQLPASAAFFVLLWAKIGSVG